MFMKVKNRVRIVQGGSQKKQVSDYCGVRKENTCDIRNVIQKEHPRQFCNVQKILLLGLNFGHAHAYSITQSCPTQISRTLACQAPLSMGLSKKV